jgi:FixJ family two-component response regulator
MRFRLLSTKTVHRTDHEVPTELRQRLTSNPRERTVMNLIVAGWRNKQNPEIQTSEETVKVHRSNLMWKIQASSLVDLLAMTGMPDSWPELERPKRSHALN